MTFSKIGPSLTYLGAIRGIVPQKTGAEAFAQLELAQFGGKAERHVFAFAAEEIDQHAAALDRSRHRVEDETGRAVLVHRHARDYADILLPRQAAHVLDLAEP